MAHFARINKDNGWVHEVLVIEQDVIDSGLFGDPSSWIKASYNTRGGVHYDPDTGLPSGKPQVRKNFPGPGYTYDFQRDAFIPPKPYNSWVLNEDTCTWEPPTPQPERTETHHYYWNEETVSWVQVENTPS